MYPFTFGSGIEHIASRDKYVVCIKYYALREVFNRYINARQRSEIPSARGIIGRNNIQLQFVVQLRFNLRVFKFKPSQSMVDAVKVLSHDRNVTQKIIYFIVYYLYFHEIARNSNVRVHV